MSEPRYYEGDGAYDMFGWKGKPAPAPPPVAAEDDDLLDDEPDACPECGDYLTGDKYSGLGCPTCEGSASWRYS